MQQVGLSLLLKKKQLNQTEKEFLVRDFFENTSFKKVKARQRKIKVYQFRTSTEATLILLIQQLHQKHQSYTACSEI